MLENSSDLDKISNSELQAQIEKMRLEIRKYNQSDAESNPSDYQEMDQDYDEDMGKPEKYPRIDSPQMISNKDSININLKKKYALINAPISPIRQKQ